MKIKTSVYNKNISCICQNEIIDGQCYLMIKIKLNAIMPFGEREQIDL